MNLSPHLLSLERKLLEDLMADPRCKGVFCLLRDEGKIRAWERGCTLRIPLL